MSATIIWTPIDKGVVIDCGAPSTFIDKMKLIFGDFPIVLNRTNIPRLEVMAMMFDDKEIDFDREDNPYTELIKALKQFDAIEVTAMF